MDNNTATRPSRTIYNKIRNLVKKYGIDFIENDQFIEAYIDYFLIIRSTKSLTDQEVYHDVETDLSHGLIYILKIVERLKKEYPLLNIRYTNYYGDRSRSIITADLRVYKHSINLDFKQFTARIFLTELGTVVEWSIVPRQDRNSEINKNTLLKNNISSTDLIKDIQADVQWLITELHNN